MIINTKHQFWSNPNNKLSINVTQSNVFVNQSDSIELDIYVINEDPLEDKPIYISGTIMIAMITILGIVLIRLLFKH